MSARQLFDNFDLIATSPGGIAKLKETILTLAMQGRLVPQDESDEPAAILLQRIKSEKQQLIAQGKLKKEKPLPPITAEEQPYELPTGWEWVRLGEIGIINPRNACDDDDEVSFIPMTLISEAYFAKPDMEKRQWKEIKSGFTHFAEHDVVLAKITPCFQNGKAAVMTGLINGIGAGTTELHVYRRYTADILPEYIYLFIKSSGFVLQGIDKMTGTAGQQRVPKEYVQLSPVPLPPLAEQHRIVAKIEELFAACEDLATEHNRQQDRRQAYSVSALHHLADAPSENFAQYRDQVLAGLATILATPADVKQLRQTILTLAMQGRLVPQEESDEPATILLQRIRSEKQQLIAQGKLKKEKPLPPIRAEEQPYELPIGWEWVRLGEICTFIDYRGKTPEKTSSGIPLITAKNVKKGFLSFDIQEYITETDYEKWMTRGFPDYGDVIITTEAPLGNVAQLFIEGKYALAQRTIVLKGYIFSKTYLKHYLMAEVFRTQLFAKKTGTTAEGIKAERLKTLLVHVPPLAEQHRIVAKIEELFAACEDLEAALARSADRQAGLTASILHAVSSQ